MSQSRSDALLADAIGIANDAIEACAKLAEGWATTSEFRELAAAIRELKLPEQGTTTRRAPSP